MSADSSPRRSWISRALKMHLLPRSAWHPALERVGAHEISNENGARAECNSLPRTARQVMVSNLPFDCTEKEIEEFCSEAGQVVAVKIVRRRNSRKSKG